MPQPIGSQYLDNAPVDVSHPPHAFLYLLLVLSLCPKGRSQSPCRPGPRRYPLVAHCCPLKYSWMKVCLHHFFRLTVGVWGPPSQATPLLHPPFPTPSPESASLPACDYSGTMGSKQQPSNSLPRSGRGGDEYWEPTDPMQKAAWAGFGPLGKLQRPAKLGYPAL